MSKIKGRPPKGIRRGRPRKPWKYKYKPKPVKWLTYDIAKLWTQRMGFRSVQHFNAYQNRYKLPKGMPKNPADFYGKKGLYEGDTIFYGCTVPIIMPYHQAQQYVASLNIITLADYAQHYNNVERKKRSLRLPYNPYYCNSWKPFYKGWDDFKGLAPKMEYLPYNEARAYIHTLRLQNGQQWNEWCKSEMYQPFIPKSPEKVYKDQYKSIMSWLGTDIVSTLEVRQQDIAVWVIIHKPENPSNIYNLIRVDMGITLAKKMCKDQQYEMIRVYQYEDEMVEEVNAIIQNYSSSFYDDEFVVPNFDQLRYKLDMTLLIVR